MTEKSDLDIAVLLDEFTEKDPREELVEKLKNVRKSVEAFPKLFHIENQIIKKNYPHV
eukprot:UN27144